MYKWEIYIWEIYFEIYMFADDIILMLSKLINCNSKNIYGNTLKYKINIYKKKYQHCYLTEIK